MKDFWYWYKVPVIGIAVSFIVLVLLVYGLDKSIKTEQAKTKQRTSLFQMKPSTT